MHRMQQPEREREREREREGGREGRKILLKYILYIYRERES